MDSSGWLANGTGMGGDDDFVALDVGTKRVRINLRVILVNRAQDEFNEVVHDTGIMHAKDHGQRGMNTFRVKSTDARMAGR